jgi:hypothetical protein
MQIKMETLQAGPAGVRLPDRVYKVSDAEGQALILGGYAVEVKAAPKAEDATPQESPVEVEPPEIEQAERSTRSGSRKAVKST